MLAVREERGWGEMDERFERCEAHEAMLQKRRRSREKTRTAGNALCC